MNVIAHHAITQSIQELTLHLLRIKRKLILSTFMVKVAKYRVLLSKMQ